MLGLPQSKSIRRADLESQSSSEGPRSSDLEIEACFREQLEQKYAYPEEYHIVKSNTGEPSRANVPSTVGPPVDDDEVAYDFRLFARSAGSGAPASQKPGLQRITLRSPTPINAEPGFMKAQRPQSYYLTGATTAELAEQFFRSAVSGKQVVECLKTRWRGLEMPWRVAFIRQKHSPQAVSPDLVPQEPSTKRKRSGKKRRIILRKRIEAKSAMQSAAQQNLVEKKAAERDKRTRRNREKKVKKKQKEKLKKCLGAQDDGQLADSD